MSHLPSYSSEVELTRRFIDLLNSTNVHVMSVNPKSIRENKWDVSLSFLTYLWQRANPREFDHWSCPVRLKKRVTFLDALASGEVTH